ncbi:MAG TPA: hypothetical protein VIV57_09470 [Anaeromyxobacter sp.]
MSDFEAIPLEVADATSEQCAGRLEEARFFASGLLFTAALVVVGTVLLTAALVIGVVGSPILAAAAAYLLVRNRRSARQRAFAPFRAA